jgi:3-oxoacyl-[acyl-carrier protein] reductase
MAAVRKQMHRPRRIGAPCQGRAMQESSIGMRGGDELLGRVALVTGAARNIGRAIALSLSAGGACVVVNTNTSLAAAQETVDLIRKRGGTAELHLADVTNASAVAGMVGETIDRFGRLDILVNNAAVRHETSLLDMSFEEWRTVMAVVLDGAFLCTQTAMPHLLAAPSGGAIVNIGGQTGHLPVAGRAHVVSAKAGLVAFTKAVALEFAGQDVTANCVVPGLIDTVRGLPGAPERPLERRIPPVGRMGLPEEVAAVVRMLAGPEGRYLTGQTIHVNGGGYMP